MSRTQHSHLEFYNNSISNNIGNGNFRGMTMGGSELVPSLQLNNNNNNGQNESKEGGDGIVVNFDHRTDFEKTIDIVNYLMKLPSDSKASFVDILRELKINLAGDIGLLEKLKNHPSIEHSKTSDGTIFFNYRSKYTIRNKRELLFTIDRVRTGIALSDIQDCYPGLEADVNSMMVGGELIAVHNKDKKTFILFPRGVPFLSELSGTVTATHGKQTITTSENLTSEIRRGEAIKVGEYWYRISCAVGSGTTQKSTAPFSVTSDKDLSADNVYILPYHHNLLPLDGDFDIGGDVTASTSSLNQTPRQYQGAIFKHGCTNDIKDLWKKTAEIVKPLVNDEHNLHQELIKYGLIRNLHFTSTNNLKKRKNENTKEKKKRHRLREFEVEESQRLGGNAHLRGTAVEALLKDVRTKYNDQFRS